MKPSPVVYRCAADWGAVLLKLFLLSYEYLIYQSQHNFIKSASFELEMGRRSLSHDSSPQYLSKFYVS